MNITQLHQDYNYLLQRSMEIETLRTTLEKHLSKAGSERANDLIWDIDVLIREALTKIQKQANKELKEFKK